MSNYQTFRHYRISQDANGAAVELWRSDADIVCLAVDTLRQVFVELHVAIIDPSTAVDLKTFQTLTQALGLVKSPHIMEVVDSGEDEGAMYAVTEIIDGERLDTYLARCNPVPEWLALQILMQLTTGLEELSSQPRLLINVELFNAAVQLLGDTPHDLCVKLADFRLALLPSKEALVPGYAVRRLVQDCGRLLAYMLTGSASEVSLLPNALKRLSPEMAKLVTILVTPEHGQNPQSFTDLSLLLEAAVGALPADQSNVPAKLAPSLRPKLPLQPHLSSQSAVTAALGTELAIAHQNYDAAAPYQLTASYKENRHAVTIHLLPPDRLMPRDFTRAIRSTQQRVNALDHPHLLRIHQFSEEEGKDWLVEESGGKFTLADLYLLKKPLSPSDAVIVLEHLQEATREAEACGLTPVVRSLRQIYVQFRPEKGQPTPQERDLVDVALEDWPPFHLRLRTFPTTLNLTQPGRYVLERQVGELPGGADTGNLGKLSSLLTAASSRDFALITCWLTAGHPSTGEKMRHLLLDYLSPRKGRNTPPTAKEFLDRLSILVGRSATRKPVQPKTPSRKSKLAVEEAAESTQLLAPEPVTIPAFGEMVTHKKPTVPSPPEPKAEPRANQARAFGSPVATTELTRAALGKTGPVGFAEALFQQPSADSEPPSLSYDDQDEDYSTPAHGIFGGLSDPEDATSPFDLNNTIRNAEIDPELLDDEPAEKPRSGLLLLWIILCALLIAGIMAHLLGTAFWLPKKI